MFDKIMDNKQIRRTNLDLLIAEAGTQDALARRVGTSRSYLSQVKSGLKAPGDDLARRLERGTGRPHGWMDHYHPTDASDVESTAPLNSVPLIEWDHLSRVPLRTSKKIGVWKDIDKTYPPETWVQTDAKIDGHGFALRVRGRAMVSPAGFPTYPVGARIIVDTHREPVSGDRVVVLIAADGDSLLRQYIPEGRKIWLYPLNPTYRRQLLKSGDKIVGVVVQTIVDG